MKSVFALATTFCLLCTPFTHAEVRWVGSVSSDVFDVANWDLGDSDVAAVEANVSIEDDVVIGAGPFDNDPIIPNLDGQVRLQVADGFTLTVEGVLAPEGNDGFGGDSGGDGDLANDGVEGPIVNVVNGGQFNPFFFVNNVRVNIDSVSSATLGGGGNPVNASSVNMEPGAVLAFLNETPDAFCSEHAAKILVGGVAVNDCSSSLIEVVGDGASGSMVTAVPEPASGLLLLASCLAMLSQRRLRR